MTDEEKLTITATGKKHLIFDFDNTLFYLHLPWSKWHEMMMAAAQKKGVELITKTPAWSTNVNEAVKAFPDLVVDFRQVQSTFETNYLDGYDINTPVLRWIKSHTEFGFSIWSAQSLKTISTILDAHHLSSVFHLIMCRDTLRFIKPDPEGFQLINAEHLPNADFLMIGDSRNDEEAARAANIDFLQLSMGHV